MNQLPRLNPDAGIYLALGGGAARGFAHLGALIALERAKIPIAGICGTSMGALVGACYALMPKAETVAHDFVTYIKSSHFDTVRYAFMNHAKRNSVKPALFERLRLGYLLGKSMTTGSIISYEDYCAEIHALLPHRRFGETELPFFATAVDLTEMTEVVFNDGYLRSAVLASAAIPGAFPAVQSGDAIYVDGGWVNRVPVSPLRCFGARLVLALDVSDSAMPADIDGHRGLAIYDLANCAARERLYQLQLEGARVVWRLPVQDVDWADFTGIERIVELGMQYAEEHMHELYPLLEPPPKLAWWKRAARRLGDVQEPPLPEPGFDLRSIGDVFRAEKWTQH